MPGTDDSYSLLVPVDHDPWAAGQDAQLAATMTPAAPVPGARSAPMPVPPSQDQQLAASMTHQAQQPLPEAVQATGRVLRGLGEQAMLPAKLTQDIVEEGLRGQPIDEFQMADRARQMAMWGMTRGVVAPEMGALGTFGGKMQHQTKR